MANATHTKNRKDEAAAVLISMKVPMIRRTTGGVSEWLPCTLTKRDKFYRINGKIVSGNIARYAHRAGLIGEAA